MLFYHVPVHSIFKLIYENCSQYMVNSAFESDFCRQLSLWRICTFIYFRQWTQMDSLLNGVVMQTILISTEIFLTKWVHVYVAPLFLGKLLLPHLSIIFFLVAIQLTLTEIDSSSPLTTILTTDNLKLEPLWTG